MKYRIEAYRKNLPRRRIALFFDADNSEVAKETFKEARKMSEFRWEDLDLQRIEGEKIIDIDTKQRDASIIK